MIGESNVATFARIVDAATLHLDCHNVSWSVIVIAARLRAELDPAYIGTTGRHTEFRNERKLRSSGVLRKTRQFAGCGRRSASPVSNAASVPMHPASAYGRDSWGGRKA